MSANVIKHVTGKNLDYKNCLCRNRIVAKLVQECTNIIDENKIHNGTLNAISSNDCTSCTVYVVLFAVFLTTSVIIGSSFIYFRWYLKNKQLNLKKMLLKLSIQKLKH